MWLEEAVLEALDSNATDSVASWGAWKKMEVVRDAACTYTMTRIPFPLFNSFMKPRLPAGAAASYADMSITLAQRNNVPVMWWSGARPSPDDLGKALVSRGFLKAEGLTGMASWLGRTNLTRETHLDIEEVLDEADLADWCEVVCPAHEVAEPYRVPWAEMFLAVGFGDASPWRHFVGYIGGTPVAASSSYVGAGVASIANVAVAPDYRGWGFGHDISAAPLKLARETGFKISTLWSSEHGRPVYENMGFVPLCKGAMYLWTPD
ncbi:GNAT family N-acetyltransferase [Chloroflexota bacterium]